jgi:hypothetical protein
MSQRYITPIERNRRIKNAICLDLVAYGDNDLETHLVAMDQLLSIGEDEIAEGFIKRWSMAQAEEEEKSRTLDSAYSEAINA